MLEQHWSVFLELIRAPFQREAMVWGVVPLYFGWIVNELTSPRASYSTATQTGFGFLWAGAHWTWQYLHDPAGAGTTRALGPGLFAVNILVTMLVIVVGLVTLVAGLRRKFPRHCAFLGHTRFSAYFMIAMFPIQSGYLPWTWERLAAIVTFVVPIWLAFTFGLMPFRPKRGHRS